MNSDQFLISNLYPISAEYLSTSITDPRQAASILKVILARRAVLLTDEEISQLRTDILYLYGFSYDDYSVATTRNISLNVSDVFNIHVNKKGYGINELSFEDTYTDIYIAGSPKLPKGDGYRSHNVVKTQHYSDRIRVSSFYETDYFCAKKNVLKNSYDKKRTLHLHYFFDTGRATYIKDGQVQYLYPYQIPNPLHSSFLKEITSYNTRLNFEELSRKPFNSLMKYLRNPLWQDLDYPYLDFIDAKDYQRLKYHHSRYGTKALRTQFYRTSYRSVQRILRTSSHAVVKTYSNLVTEGFLTDVPVDVQVTLCTVLKQIPGPYSAYSLTTAIKNMLTYGFSLNKIIARIPKDSRFVPDIGNYGLNLYEAAGVNLNDGMRQIHDKLSTHYQRVRDHAYYGRSIELTEKELQMNFSKDGFVFKPADITDDLCTLGHGLQICVRSYDHLAISKGTTIVGIYKEDEPVACIDIRHNSIVQAKLYRNTLLKTKPELQEIVLEWAQLNDLSISTRDIEQTILEI